MKKRARSTAAKDVLTVFVPTFLFFAAVGAVAGYEERPETARVRLYEGLELKRAGERYVFEVRCEPADWTYVYDVDRNDGRLIASLSAHSDHHTTALGVPSARHMKELALLSAFLGGTTGGVTFKDVFQTPVTRWTWNQVRRTVLGALGTISGYTAGYMLASRYNTGCDSPFVAEWIKTPGAWLRFQTDRIAGTIRELESLEGARRAPNGRISYPWQADPGFKCSKALVAAAATLLSNASDALKDPTSEHFALLDRIKRVHNRIAASPEYATRLRLGVIAGTDVSLTGPLAVRQRAARDESDRACEAIDRMTADSAAF